MAKWIQSIPGGGVGGAPPPGTGFASGTYPTLSHSATQISPNAPPDLNPVTSRTLFWCICRRFACGPLLAAVGPNLQEALQERRLHDRLRVSRLLPSLRGALWGTRKTRCLVAVTAVALAGCGGAGAGGEGDPATVTPPGAAIYGEVVVRPEGSQREDALAAAGKVLRTDDPEARIRELVTEAIREEHGEALDYERDLEPWLGERAAVWAAPTQDGANDPTVVVLAATDIDAAREALERLVGSDASERSHRGSDYLVDASGMAAGVVGDFVAIGPEAQYKRTVDAAEGESLAEDDAYADAAGALDDERLAHLWIDLPVLAERAQDELGGVVPLGDLQPIAASFAADGDRLLVETRGDLVPLLAAGSTRLLRELPGDSWLAFGVADLGEAIDDTIQDFAGPLGAMVARREVERSLGLDLERDLLGWIGDAGFFLRGTTPATIDGGLVIEPTDEDRAADAFGRIVGALQVRAQKRARPVDVAGADQAFELAERGLARPIVLARGSGLVVVAAGRAAAEAALGAGDSLGDGALYAEGEELLDMEPGMVLSMPAVLELLDASEPDAEYDQVRPYLEVISTIAAGTDDDSSGRVVAGLR
jgi:hypothetical protein